MAADTPVKEDTVRKPTSNPDGHRDSVRPISSHMSERGLYPAVGRIKWLQKKKEEYPYFSEIPAFLKMSSRKVSVCSAATSGGADDEPTSKMIPGEAQAQQVYPYAVALRVRVLQIVCGIGSIVVGAVGWLEERTLQTPALGLGVPAGALAVLAASVSVYCSRGFGGWSAPGSAWGAPWRVLGPTPKAALPLTVLWTLALAAHSTMLALAARVLMHLGCGSRTCTGVASAQLALSAAELAAAGYMLQLDLRLDAS